MKIVPSEFSNSAWDCFIFAKEIAYKNHQQDVDSDNLLFALLKEDNFTKKILKKNNVNIKELETKIMTSLKSKANLPYPSRLKTNTAFGPHSMPPNAIRVKCTPKNGNSGFGNGYTRFLTRCSDSGFSS